MLFIVFVTHPDKVKAKELSTILVKENLAACVNILPGVESVYQWEAKIEFGNEVLLLIKTSSNKLQDLEKRVLELHPYSTPEFVAVPASYVTEKYMMWVNSI